MLYSTYNGFVKAVIYHHQYFKAAYQLWFADILVFPHLADDFQEQGSPRSLMVISGRCVDGPSNQPTIYVPAHILMYPAIGKDLLWIEIILFKISFSSILFLWVSLTYSRLLLFLLFFIDITIGHHL